MYSPSAYYLSGYFSTIIITLFYPFLSSAVSYKFLKFTHAGFTNYIEWSTTLATISLQGMTFGYMLGAIFDDMDMGINVFALTMMLFVCGSGLYVRLKTAN